MDVIWTKVAVMALISLTLVASLLPFWFKKYFVPANHRQSPTRALVISVLLCFGAGVLLSTAMVHMLPEVGLEAKHDKKISLFSRSCGFVGFKQYLHR